MLFVRRPAPLDISKRSRADVGPGRFAPASRWCVKGGTHSTDGVNRADVQLCTTQVGCEADAAMACTTGADQTKLQCTTLFPGYSADADFMVSAVACPADTTGTDLPTGDCVKNQGEGYALAVRSPSLYLPGILPTLVFGITHHLSFVALTAPPPSPLLPFVSSQASTASSRPRQSVRTSPRTA